MKIINEKEILNELQKGLINPPRTALVDYLESQVNYGFDEKPNFEYCHKQGINCVDIGRRGGAFMVNKGDIGLGHIAKGFDNSLGNEVNAKFLEYLCSKGLNANASGNDILIDGYKVFGWASHYYKEYNATFISIHFTMSVNLDLINAVCIKPMVKVPKGLTEFGITREEIIEFLNQII